MLVSSISSLTFYQNVFKKVLGGCQTLELYGLNEKLIVSVIRFSFV